MEGVFDVRLIKDFAFRRFKMSFQSSKLNFVMKYHSDFLPIKFELATPNNSPFLYNRVESFSVCCTAIDTLDLKEIKIFEKYMKPCF